tara:strand:- start:570 stop:1358 length:789 start_codon:yes stop_codon:yes gene_type:complete
MKKFDFDEQPSLNEASGMTHYVDLPTQGNYYPEGHPLHGEKSLEIKMLTTKEEDILSNPSYIENEVVVEKLLESIIIKKIPADQIYDSDKMAILICARIEAYGKDYEILKACTSCGEDYEHVVELDSHVGNFINPEHETTEKGTVICELPKSKKVVEFRHLLPAEISSIEKTAEKMKKININTTINEEIYKRIILSVDGEENPSSISNFVNNMRILDSKKLFRVYSNSLPKVNLNFTSSCSHCGAEQEGGLPIQANFFYPEL